MTIAELARTAEKTGGPIAGHHEVNAEGAGVSFSVHIADVEVDQETGRITVSRYTVVQDAGKAIHPDYVEGQYQGGAAQGIGWAINEGYYYGDGRKAAEPELPRLSDAGRLGLADDRCEDHRDTEQGPPVRRPRRRRDGDRAAAREIGNAVRSAIGLRIEEVPMAPPVVLEAIEKANGAN